MTQNNADDQINNILLVYSPRGAGTLRQAVKMAKDNQAGLTIIDVADDLDEYKGLLPANISEHDLKKAISGQRRAVIEEQVNNLAAVIPQPDIHIGFGKPAVEIIRHAMAFGHDLVIKTAAGGTGISERLFGNTAIKLLRKCPGRVLIAKPDGPPALKRVLAAIDPMPASDRTVALNQHILRTAAQIARMEAGQLDIVHCWHLPGQSMLSFGRTKISAAELNQMQTMAEKLHRQKLTEFVDRMQLDGPSLKLHLLNGNPVESVLYFADRMKSDLVVIGTADKSALAGLLMGSTAESIIDKSKTSVLAIKPAGFISPITPGY